MVTLDKKVCFCKKVCVVLLHLEAVLSSMQLFCGLDNMNCDP